jgi:hypothetical protein|tara:strand:- start:994 stop:1239 length:246 start_codon:yes stop_codon:yes gene_type:complete
MIAGWLKVNHWRNFHKDDTGDSFWFQKQMLIKRYKVNKQGQPLNQSKAYRHHVKIRLVNHANSNLISFKSTNTRIRKIKEA